MKANQRRQFEMLQRVRDFGTTHGHLFSGSGVGQEAFGCIAAAVDELTATALMKRSASVSARSDRKATTRRALYELLIRVSQLARVLRARGRTVPPFVPPKSKSDQDLLTTARQFARDAAGLDADFKGHGMGAKTIETVTTTFEMAARDRGMKLADHTAALARIRELIANALLDVRRLDLLVHNELPHDPVTRAVWKQARHIGKGPRPGAAAEAPAAPETADAPEPARVIQMPAAEPA